MVCYKPVMEAYEPPLSEGLFVTGNHHSPLGKSWVRPLDAHPWWCLRRLVIQRGAVAPSYGLLVVSLTPKASYCWGPLGTPAVLPGPVQRLGCEHPSMAVKLTQGHDSWFIPNNVLLGIFNMFATINQLVNHEPTKPAFYR